MTVTVAVLRQPLASFTVRVYVPTHKALTVFIVAGVVTVEPVDQVYV